jgi:hypothetical protein
LEDWCSYGRLFNWQNPPDPFWHYGIGLSDTHIFDPGQGNETASKLYRSLGFVDWDIEWAKNHKTDIFLNLQYLNL